MSTLRSLDDIGGHTLLHVEDWDPSTDYAYGRVVDTRKYQSAAVGLSVIAPANLNGDTLTVTVQDSPPPVMGADIYPYDGTDDGSEELRDGAASNLYFASAFTPTVTGSIYEVELYLSREGTPAVVAGNEPWVGLVIMTDAAGVPSGTQVGSPSLGINTSDIPTTPGYVKFYFDRPINVTALTTYHIVLAGNYDVSLTDCVHWHYNTVGAGAQVCSYYDAAWAALALKNFWFRYTYLVFADTTWVHDVLTDNLGNSFNEMTDYMELTNLNSENRFLRAKYVGTLGGTTWDIAHVLLGSHPRVRPVT